jgi:thiamine biosynthesis lipoprotein
MNRAFAELKRRDLLRLACLAGLGLAIPLTEFLDIRGSEVRQLELQRSIKALGTTVTIRVEEDLSPAKAEAGINDTFSEIRRLETQLTRFQPSSQVHRLNQTGQLETPAPELFDVLNKARHFYDRTDGAFDITVKPALDLLQRCLVGTSLPSDAEFETAKGLIDSESLSVSKDIVSFWKPGMGITLDCIGKGYVLDMAAARLRAHGIRSALVQGGGTLVAIGTRLDGSPWRIGVRDPKDPNSLIGTISLVDGAVATSGDYENFFSPDGTCYHIVDPSTARSPLYSHSATVAAPTAHEADPLGVALMVKEPREGLKLLEGFRGDECLIATRDGRLVRSSGFGVIS